MSQRNLMSKSTSTEHVGRWRERFDRFLNDESTAELTVAEFCRCEGVSVASFYQWKRKLAIRSTGRRKVKRKATDDGRFVPLVVQHAAVGARLMLPGGAVLELPGELEPRRLTELLAAVVQATDRADASNVSRRAAEDA